MELTEEKCIEAVDDIEYDLCELETIKTGVVVFCIYNESLEIIRDLIKEHFELLEVLKECGWSELTPKGLRVVIEAGQYNAKKLNELRNPQPYKFEDLKPNMWVWDDKEKKCNKIIEIEGRNIDFYYITESIDRFIVEFEEGRFYPITKALYEGLKGSER